MKITFLLILIGVCSMISAQTYSGIIYDQSTKEPLPYVNIGILHRGVGSVSQEDGSFHIALGDEFNNDTLRISMIGYTTKIFLISNFRKQYTENNISIYLTQDIQQLTEVRVRPRDMKTDQLGNDFNAPNIMAGFKTDSLGSEVGTIMKIKNNRTYYLKTAGFNIARCDYDSITFRINIYDYTDRGPGELLHSLPIYVKAYKGQRSIIVDLVPFDISVDHDFVLSLEWVQDLPDKTTAFMFCAGFFGNRIFYRMVSQDDWKTFPIGIGSYCIAEYEK